MGHKGLHPLAPVMEVGKKPTLLVKVAELMKYVNFPLLSEGISDLFLQKATGHDQEMTKYPPRPIGIHWSQKREYALASKGLVSRKGVRAKKGSGPRTN
jgi:hypothetical protein